MEFILARDRAGLTRIVSREITHTRWITNIVFRMHILFHFHAGFTGRRDYQSCGHAHSFLNLHSMIFVLVLFIRPSYFRCHRGFNHSEIAIWQFEAIEVAKLYDQWRNWSIFWKKLDFMWGLFVGSIKIYYNWKLLWFYKMKC